jgi:hypothetical protein
MYVGHFAIGIAIKSISPKTPTLPIMLGVGLMDIVDGILIVAGIDRVTPNFKSGPYLFFDLIFIDSDHSVLMAILLSLLWAGLFRSDRRTVLILAVAVFSHFLADWPLHNHDLALYPYSRHHLGFGLWDRLGTMSWVLEGAFSVAMIAVAFWRNKYAGVPDKWALLLLSVLFVQMSPWFSPMKVVAQLPEPGAHVVHGLLVATGFFVPGLILTWLIDRGVRESARNLVGRDG